VTPSYSTSLIPPTAQVHMHIVRFALFVIVVFICYFSCIQLLSSLWAASMLIDWLTDWLIDRLINWLIDWLRQTHTLVSSANTFMSTVSNTILHVVLVDTDEKQQRSQNGPSEERQTDGCHKPNVTACRRCHLTKILIIHHVKQCRPSKLVSSR